MMTGKPTLVKSRRRLSGRSVFLSASVPDPQRDERFIKIADAVFQVEQAVISLARAVFSEGGKLVFGGHPSISPLVGMVAGEYRAPNLAEGGERAPAQVIIYQSEAFREATPRDTDMLIGLGLAEDRWIAAVGEELFIPGQGSGHQQCPRSLRAMRARMIEETNPAAMVCIGGMEGVLIEAEMFAFADSQAPIFTLANSGGAASLVTEGSSRAIPIDLEIARDLAHTPDDEPVSHGGEIQVQPYPLIMQTIIDRIAPPEREGERERGQEH